MTVRAQHDADLARNLIETLGAQRAMHVAIQFAWYGVAEEISVLAKNPSAAAEIRSDESPDPAVRWMSSATYLG